MQIFCFIFVENRAESVLIALIEKRFLLLGFRFKKKPSWNKSEIQLPWIWWVNKNVRRNQIKIGKGKPSQRSIPNIMCFVCVCEKRSYFAIRILPYELSSPSALWASWRFNFWISSVRSQDVQVLSKATNTRVTWKYVTQC